MSEVVTPGDKEKSTGKIREGRKDQISADSDQTGWQMDVVEFNLNGCLINAN